MFKRKKLTAIKGRSSGLLVSIIIHVALLLIAGTFVAVTVIVRDEAKFEGRQIVRPKMKLKKLQVPVKIEKRAATKLPNVSQRITANAQTKSVDFKMPELAGFSGGMNVDLASTGMGAGGLNFAMAQFNVFGVRSRGEKVLFVLDTNQQMLLDEVGGIPAYKIIKDELSALLSRIPPTTLFNVIVFEGSTSQAFSPEMSVASDENIKKLKEWLDPLNSHQNRYGIWTLAWRGTTVQFERNAPIYNNQSGWIAALSYGVQKGVDSIYCLGTTDTLTSIDQVLFDECKKGKELKYLSGRVPDNYAAYDYDSPAWKKWDETVSAAYKKLNEENAARLAKGQPVRVLAGNEEAVVRAYFPGATKPPAIQRQTVSRYTYTANDVLSYIAAMQTKYSESDRHSASVGLKKKTVTVNVVHFVPAVGETGELTILRNLAARTKGGYVKISGLEAIRSTAAGGAL